MAKQVKLTRTLRETLADILDGRSRVDSAQFGELERGGFILRGGVLTPAGREQAIAAKEAREDSQRRNREEA